MRSRSTGSSCRRRRRASSRTSSTGSKRCLAAPGLPPPPRRRSGAAGVTGGVVEPFPAIASRFGAEPTLLEEDFTEGDSGVEWMLGNGGSPGQPARSLLGARLEVGGAQVGYLLLGSVARDAYRPVDEETLS